MGRGCPTPPPSACSYSDGMPAARDARLSSAVTYLFLRVAESGAPTAGTLYAWHGLRGGVGTRRTLHEHAHPRVCVLVRLAVRERRRRKRAVAALEGDGLRAGLAWASWGEAFGLVASEGLW